MSERETRIISPTNKILYWLIICLIIKLNFFVYLESDESYANKDRWQYNVTVNNESKSCRVRKNYMYMCIHVYVCARTQYYYM